MLTNADKATHARMTGGLLASFVSRSHDKHSRASENMFHFPIKLR